VEGAQGAQGSAGPQGATGGGGGTCPVVPTRKFSSTTVCSGDGGFTYDKTNDRLSVAVQFSRARSGRASRSDSTVTRQPASRGILLACLNSVLAAIVLLGSILAASSTLKQLQLIPLMPTSPLIGELDSARWPMRPLLMSVCNPAAGVVEINSGTAGTFRDLAPYVDWRRWDLFSNADFSTGLVEFRQRDFGAQVICQIGEYSVRGVGIGLTVFLVEHPDGTLVSTTIDVAIKRTNAGIVEINNGTADQFRDLAARSLFLAAVDAPLITGTQTGVTSPASPCLVSAIWSAAATSLPTDSPPMEAGAQSKIVDFRFAGASKIAVTGRTLVFKDVALANTALSGVLAHGPNESKLPRLQGPHAGSCTDDTRHRR
jgi:hypothetical protein